MSESEVWKDITGYEGLYMISNKGNVYSVRRRDSRGIKCGGRILKPRYSGNGYLQVDLRNNGKRKTKYIHRLVTEAFIPNPESLPQINHIDEVKDNNNVENLEWCDSSYNINYGTRTERVSKKVRAVNVETGEIVTFSSVKEAEKKGYYNISQACRGAYKSGKTGKLIGGDGRTYKGHKWSYDE